MKCTCGAEKSRRRRVSVRVAPSDHAANREQELAVFEALWLRNPAANLLGKRVAARQKRLHDAIDQRAWSLYLAVEEAVNRRHVHLMELARAFWSTPDSRRHDGVRAARR